MILRLSLVEIKNVFEQMPYEMVLAALSHEEVNIQKNYLKSDINRKAKTPFWFFKSIRPATCAGVRIFKPDRAEDGCFYW